MDAGLRGVSMSFEVEATEERWEARVGSVWWVLVSVGVEGSSWVDLLDEERFEERGGRGSLAEVEEVGDEESIWAEPVTLT